MPGIPSVSSKSPSFPREVECGNRGSRPLSVITPNRDSSGRAKRILRDRADSMSARVTSNHSRRRDGGPTESFIKSRPPSVAKPPPSVTSA